MFDVAGGADQLVDFGFALGNAAFKQRERQESGNGVASKLRSHSRAGYLTFKVVVIAGASSELRKFSRAGAFACHGRYGDQDGQAERAAE